MPCVLALPVAACQAPIACTLNILPDECHVRTVTLTAALDPAP